LFVLFFDSTKPMPASKFRADITVIGVAADRPSPNSTYTDPPPAPAFQEHHLSRRDVRLLDMDPKLVEQLIGEQYKGKGKACCPSNIHALHLGRDWALQNLKCPIGPAHQEIRQGRRTASSIEGQPVRPRSARYMVAPPSAHGTRSTPSSSLGRRLSGSHCKKLRHDPKPARRSTHRSRGGRTGLDRIVIGASWNGAPRLYRYLRSRHLADDGIHRPVLLRRDSGCDHERAARRSVHWHADAHPAMRHHCLRLCLPWRYQACAAVPEDPAEAFEFAAQAFDLAERLQTTIFVMLDLDIGMNHRLCRPLKWDDARQYDRGKVMTAEMLDDGRDFGRYLDIDGDGIPYRTYPGTHPTKGSFFTRGTSRDRYARYSEEGSVYADNMQRLVRKFESAQDMVPRPLQANAAKPTK